MKSYQLTSKLMIVPVLAAGLFVAGCKTVVRENIISTIDTGVGATIAENKETQAYELKAGYIRSQFFSIPTGKLVENTNGADGIEDAVIVTSPDGKTSHKGRISNAANVTPQVVSGIRAHTGLGDLILGMDVSENFAVGKDAVNSQAAVVMYFSQIANTNVASAASEAVQKATAAVKGIPDSGNEIRTEMGKLSRAYANAAADKPKYDQAAQGVGYPAPAQGAPANTPTAFQNFAKDNNVTIEKIQAVEALLRVYGIKE